MSGAISNIATMRITPPVAPVPRGDFGAVLRSAVEQAVETGHQAEAHAMKAITQGGNVTEVVTALAQAELTLQTATAVRDRMIQAYQEIMRIQI